MKLIEGSIRYPVSTTVGVILVVLFGAIALFRIPIQLVPNVDEPKVTVTTVWPGASPQEIEREIVDEQEEQLKSLEGLIKLESSSSDSVGNITLTSAGRLRLRNASTNVGVESTALQVGSTYRIGLHQTRGTGGDAVLEAFVAPDGAAFGAPFARMTNGTWTTSADRTRFGATNGTAVDLTIDDVLVSSGAMPTPLASAAAIVLAAAVPGSSYAFVAKDGMAGFLAVNDPSYTFSCPVATVA